MSHVKVMVDMTKQWTRWQDWVALVAGVYAFLSPIWTTTVQKASVTLIVLGIVTALAALWSLYAPDVFGIDIAVAVLGVLFFIAPWVMGFTGTSPMAWTSWIVGVVTFVVGALAIPMENRAHRGHGTPLAQH
ncbi:SPW repeat protein [Nostocoides japonicum]|nr:SPW repeat protein [Tetrasphaera japonica]